MEAAGGGWTVALHSATDGSFADNTSYQEAGNYYLTDVPSHTEIALFISRRGTRLAGIAGPAANAWDGTTTLDVLIDYSDVTWEDWNNGWAVYTAKNASGCFHSSWQDLCMKSFAAGNETELPVLEHALAATPLGLPPDAHHTVHRRAVRAPARALRHGPLAGAAELA